MSEKRLTEDQRNRIEVITAEWEKEREKLQNNITPPQGRTLDGERTQINIMLEKKYMPLIREIMRE